MLLQDNSLPDIYGGDSYGPLASRIQSSGPGFNIKMSSCQYWRSHCGDKTVVRSSYLHNGISYTGKMTSLHWIMDQGPILLTWISIHIPGKGWVCSDGINWQFWNQISSMYIVWRFYVTSLCFVVYSITYAHPSIHHYHELLDCIQTSFLLS